MRSRHVCPARLRSNCSERITEARLIAEVQAVHVAVVVEVALGAGERAGATGIFNVTWASSPWTRGAPRVSGARPEISNCASETMSARLRWRGGCKGDIHLVRFTAARCA